MNILSKLKGKTAGTYFLAAATLFGLISAILYLIFGVISGTFVASIFIFSVIAVVLDAVQLVCIGFFADYIPIASSTFLTISLVQLIGNSIDDVTAFFVGMGDYFGNANNVGFRVVIALTMAGTILLTIIGAFLRQRRNEM